MTNLLDQCGVCLEDRNRCDFEIFPCGHKLCHNCYPRLTNWTCPFCRSSVPMPIPQRNPSYESDYDYIESDLRREARRNQRRYRRERVQRNRGVTNTTNTTNNIVIVVEEGSLDMDENMWENEIMTRLIETFLDNDQDKDLQERRNQRSNNWNSRRNQRNISHSL